MSSRLSRRGPAALAAWLRKTGVTQTELARLVGCSQSKISEWKGGKSAPTDRLKPALEAITGIPAAAWLTTSEAKARALYQAKIKAMQEATDA